MSEAKMDTKHGIKEWVKTIRSMLADYLPLTGATIENPVTVRGGLGTTVAYRATSSDATGDLAVGVDSGGVNHGLYSFTQSKWLVHADGNNVYLDGKKTADILTIETGTWNTWYYHKYSDGRLEMWRTWTGAPTGSKHYWNSGNFYGYRSEGWGINGMVVGTDYQVDVNWKIGSGFSMAAGVNRNSGGSFHIYGIGTEANVSSVTVHLHLMGRWK